MSIAWELARIYCPLVICFIFLFVFSRSALLGRVWSGCCRMAIIYGHICTEWDLTDWSMSGSRVVSPAQQTWITAARGQTGKWNEFPVTGLWWLFRTNNYGYFTVFPELRFTSWVAYRFLAGFHLLLINPTQLSLLHSKNIVTQCAAEDLSTLRRRQHRKPWTKKTIDLAGPSPHPSMLNRFVSKLVYCWIVNGYCELLKTVNKYYINTFAILPDLKLISGM